MHSHSSAAQYLFKKRRTLFFALLIGGVVGLGITLFLPTKYLSTAIIYPPNSHLKHAIVSNPQFGYEIETEQLLQLLESKSMRDRTIKKFGLHEYYELDTTKADWKSKLTLKYVRDVQFLRSKYLSVVINATTEKPELSAAIANFQVSEVDNYRKSIFEANRQEQFLSLKSQYETSKNELDRLRSKIYELKSASGGLVFNFMESLNNENYDSKEFVDDHRLEPVVQAYIFQLNNYKGLHDRYTQMKLALEEPIPSVYIIDKAEPSYKKASPSFLINMLIGAVTSFIMMLTVLLVQDKWNELKKSKA